MGHFMDCSLLEFLKSAISSADGNPIATGEEDGSL